MSLSRRELLKLSGVLAASEAVNVALPYIFPRAPERRLTHLNYPTDIIHHAQELFPEDFSRWQKNYVTSEGAPSGGLRVVRPSEAERHTTVSEGQALGQYLAARAGDWSLFNSLDVYTLAHDESGNGLMTWQIDPDGQPSIGYDGRNRDKNSATDANLYRLHAYILAARAHQVPTSKVTELSQAILDHTTQLVTYNDLQLRVLMPGEWGGADHTNPFYHMVGRYPVFFGYTNDRRWQDVSYSSWYMIGQINARYPQSFGLLPNWSTIDGQRVKDRDQKSLDSGYDGIRAVANFAENYAWFPKHPTGLWAKSQLIRLNHFFESIPINDLKNGYTLTGKVAEPDHDTLPVAMAVMASIVSSDHRYQRQLYQHLTSLVNRGYFHDTYSLYALNFIANLS
jgi:endo-1,4-beta-D-glucanase Y